MDDHNKLKDVDEKYVEPPELRKAGLPPLRKQLNWLTIGVGVIIIVVLLFALYFIFIAGS